MHTAVLAYVPVPVPPQHPDLTWPLQFPARGQQSLALQHIVMWCCGPPHLSRCKPGALTIVPDAHSTVALLLSGCAAYDHWFLRSIHRELNALNPSLPEHINAEIAMNRYN